MWRMTAALLVTAVAGALPGMAAENPFGLYVSGAAGRSTIRNNDISITSPFTPPARYGLDEHRTGWKLTLGVRPIQLLGAEIEYIDFGHSSVTVRAPGLLFQSDAKVNAPALFGVAHLPLPLPLLDIYGKAGAARLHTTVKAIDVGHFNCGVVVCEAHIGGVPVDRTDISLAYGVGVQVKLSALAIRLEYERARVTGGDPDLLSLGLGWRF